MSLQNNSAIYTVSRLNQQVRALLEQHIGQVWLNGEISNVSLPASGHWYFTLKDAGAQVRCAMFRNSNRRADFVPRDGQHVLARANITLYEPRGDYQLVIDSLHQAGEGALQQRYQQLRQRLSDEGLFDACHKQPLPALVRRIGIITSGTGAALHDILQVLRRRDPSLPVVIYPAAVQGDEAPAQLIRALALANQRAECNLLILGRGGGSLEDLWSFNDESLARAIFASRIPVVSAVGHEVDVTIADFVADLRAPTPSAAAEMISRDQRELARQLKSAQHRLALAQDHLLAERARRLSQLAHRLHQQHPRLRLARWHSGLLALQQRLASALQIRLRHASRQQQTLWYALCQQQPGLRLQRAQNLLTARQHRLQQSFQQQFTALRQRFSRALAQMDAVSPLSTLARGYSVTRTPQGEIIRSIRQAPPGTLIHTRLPDGWLQSEVRKATALQKPKTSRRTGVT